MNKEPRTEIVVQLRDEHKNVLEEAGANQGLMGGALGCQARSAQMPHIDSLSLPAPGMSPARSRVDRSISTHYGGIAALQARPEPRW